MPVVCRNTQKKIVFMLGWEDKVGQLLVYNGGEKKHAAYHWVWFLLGQRAGRLNPKWSIEDKEPVVNELMVETAVFPFCWPDVSETGPDSLTVKLTDLFPEEKKSKKTRCLRASWMWKLAHRKITDFYGQNMLWRRSKTELVCVYAWQRRSIRKKIKSPGAAYF